MNTPHLLSTFAALRSDVLNFTWSVSHRPGRIDSFHPEATSIYGEKVAISSQFHCLKVCGLGVPLISRKNYTKSGLFLHVFGTTGIT
jgi:hypothetical protein